MHQETSNASIRAAVALEQSNGALQFIYRDKASTTVSRIAPSGDIDLRSEQSGPVHIHLELEPSRVVIDGVEHKLRLALESIWIGAERHGAPHGPYRLRGLDSFLSLLGLRKAQFHHFSSPTREHLTFIDENDDHTVYKYTLRIEAIAEDGSTRQLEHDPLIHNH